MSRAAQLTRPSFFKRWAHRLDFLKRESDARAWRLGEVIAALAQMPPAEAAARPLLLLDDPVEAGFLKKAMALRALPRVEPRVLRTVDEIVALDGELDGGDRPLLIAGPLFARHHMVLIDRFGRDRFTVL